MTISDLNMQPMQNRSLGNAFYSLIKKYFTGSRYTFASFLLGFLHCTQCFLRPFRDTVTCLEPRQPPKQFHFKYLVNLVYSVNFSFVFVMKSARIFTSTSRPCHARC